MQAFSSLRQHLKTDGQQKKNAQVSRPSFRANMPSPFGAWASVKIKCLQLPNDAFKLSFAYHHPAHSTSLSLRDFNALLFLWSWGCVLRLSITSFSTDDCISAVLAKNIIFATSSFVTGQLVLKLSPATSTTFPSESRHTRTRNPGNVETLAFLSYGATNPAGFNFLVNSYNKAITSLVQVEVKFPSDTLSRRHPCYLS